MSYVFRPSFEYGPQGDTTLLQLRWPMLPWTPADGGVGGSDTAASGIPEAFVIRLDRIVEMELRIEEDELSGYRDFLTWARGSGQAFQVRLDQEDEDTEFEAYLQFPRWEDEAQVRYQRDEAYPRVFRVPLHVRRRYGAGIDTMWQET
jgi:hypothetical protein